MTVLQQQQQRTPASPHTVSLGAGHAFSLYCESVAAGQWARLTIEQRPEGETFHVYSRSWAAAPAAARARTNEKKARRRPNKKRLAAKQLWRESRGSGPAAAVPRQQQQQQFRLPAVAATAASGSYAQVAASTASPAKTAASTVAAAHTGSLVPSPRLTRAAKRRKVLSHRDMDVAHPTPPLLSMPPEPLTPEAAPRPTVDRAAPPPSDTPPSPACEVIPQLDGAEEVPTTTKPPPPPPLPCGVLCRFCENVKHSDLFFMCAGCHWGSHNVPYLDCPDCEELRMESIHQVSHNAPLFDCPECENIRSATTM